MNVNRIIAYSRAIPGHKTIQIIWFLLSLFLTISLFYWAQHLARNSEVVVHYKTLNAPQYTPQSTNSTIVSHTPNFEALIDEMASMSHVSIWTPFFISVVMTMMSLLVVCMGPSISTENHINEIV